MSSIEQVRQVKERVAASILAIPGVIAIGVGPKLVGGVPTGELAIQILIQKKKPLSQIAPTEVIPPEIDGVKTDLTESEPMQIFDADEDKYRPLQGGAQ